MATTKEYYCIDLTNSENDNLQIKIFSNGITIVYDEVNWELDHEEALMVSDSLKANLENS